MNRMFVSYDQWMRGTKLGLTKPRSQKLKQVSYLRTCFNTWKLSKGVEWE